MRKYSLCMVFSLLVPNANAALLERLGGLAYYDDVADLTWLADANAMDGAGPFNDGMVSLDEAKLWVSQHQVFNPDTLSFVTGWRLPNTLVGDASCQDTIDSLGYYCTGSEMGNMFYNVLGGVAGDSIADTHNENYDLFTSIQPLNYWSGTDYASDINYSYAFNFEIGDQFLSAVGTYSYVWAVYDGDVNAVPIPAAVWLFGTGLIGLIGVARRKKY